MNRFLEADALLGAADTGVAATDRPVVLAGVTKAQRRAIGVGFRPFAAQFVQAIALAMAGVAEFHGEAAGIEVGATFAVFVNQAAVGKLRAAQFIDFRQLAEGQEMHHGGEEVVGIRRATGNGRHDLAQNL